jgi:hypothetical protein
MDDSLRIIQYLYGDEVDDPDFPRRVAENDELRREFDQLQDTKAALDRRSPPSPDPDVVDRVVDRAAEAARPAEPTERAPDRTARAPNRSWTRRLQNAGAAAALLLALGIGWWYAPSDSGPAANPAASASAAQQADAATASSAQDEESLPEWDDRDEVVRLHRRIEALQTQSRSDAWGGTLQSASRTRP